jgi:hypothetical protein
MDEHGVDAIVELVEDAGWSYPVSTRRFLDEYALRNIEIDEQGNSIMVGEVVDPNEFREFTGEDDIERKLTPVFERLRTERQSGIVGRLRRYFS